MSIPAEQSSTPPADDYVAVRRQDSGEIDPLDLVVPALPESLRDIRVAMRYWLAEIGAAPRAVADLLVAVGEACTNAVEHAYGPGGGTVTVHLELQMSDVLATVCDTGHWRPPRSVNRKNRGRGTQFMRNCSDDLRIDHGSTGTNVVIRRQLGEWAPRSRADRCDRADHPVESERPELGGPASANTDRSCVRMPGSFVVNR